MTHGDEGTHYNCNEKLGETCCGCSGHKCEEARMEEKKERYEVFEGVSGFVIRNETTDFIGRFEKRQDAEFFCHAANAHEKMVEVLKKADSVIHELYAENPENITYEIDEKSDAGMLLMEIEAILAEEPK